MCPHCNKKVAPSARLCVHCAGPLFDQGPTVKNPMCPKCGKRLRVIKIEGNDQAEVCSHCHGLWLDLIEFKRATHPQRIPKKYIHSRNHWHKPGHKQVQYLGCPRCGRLMNRENFSKISGIMLDKCRDHGIWLDGGELERIRLFIGSGGLEKFQDRRLDKLESKLEGVSQRTRELEFITKTLHFWDMKRIFLQGTLFH